jgi:hypothetical protein
LGQQRHDPRPPRHDHAPRLDTATGQIVDVLNRFFLHARFLPDGRQVLYVGRESEEGSPDGIYLTSVDAPEQRRRLLPTYSTTAYADGYLLFVRDGTLLAQRFDAGRAELSGDAMPVVDGLQFLKTSGFAMFDAGAGIIAYISRAPDDAPTWFDRTGREIGRLGPPGLYGDVTISPDGTRVVASQNDRRSGTGDLWLYDISRAEPTVRQLTHDTFSEQNVVWSPDGRFDCVPVGWRRAAGRVRHVDRGRPGAGRASHAGRRHAAGMAPRQPAAGHGPHRARRRPGRRR